MPVPKKRTSRSRQGMRRAHDFHTRTYAIVCPNCGEAVIPHRVCLACGQYRGKQIVKVKENTEQKSA